MADFNWNQYPQANAPDDSTAPTPPATVPGTAPPADAAPFNWDDHPIVGVVPGAAQSAQGAPPSALESLLRGGVQGATLGFGDEIQGAGEAAYQKLVGDDGGNSFSDLYGQDVDSARQANAAAQAAHPYLYGAGNVAGGLATGVATSGLAPAIEGVTGLGATASRVLTGAGMGALSGIGYGNGQSINNSAQQALEGALVGGGLSAAFEGAANAMDPDALSASANKFATNATGATGVQVSRFDPDAGQELLSRGIVGFGDTQADIAKKATDALDQSRQGISDSLNALDAAGASPISKDDVVKYLQDKLGDLSNSPAQAGTAKQIQSVIGDFENGPDSYTLNGLENEKRLFQDRPNWNDPAMSDANIQVSDALRQLVEDKATSIDPTLSAQFQDAKADYGLLKPIQEAAQRRANVTQQSPYGGFMDTAAVTGGVATGHPLAAIAAPIARRVLAPRIGSSVASALNTASNAVSTIGDVGAQALNSVVQTNPELLGPWAQQLSVAASRSPQSLAATNYILSQTDQNYRTHMKQLFSGQ